jgi:hypothetical protein
VVLASCAALQAPPEPVHAEGARSPAASEAPGPRVVVDARGAGELPPWGKQLRTSSMSTPDPGSEMAH